MPVMRSGGRCPIPRPAAHRPGRPRPGSRCSRRSWVCGWTFRPLEENASKVGLQLRYEFSNRLLEAVVGPVFRYIADTMVEAFVQRSRAPDAKA